MARFITGFFSTTAITPNIISVQKCIGRKWKASARASPSCKKRKACARSSARTCSAFSIQICPNADKVDRPLRGRCQNKWRLRRPIFSIEVRAGLALLLDPPRCRSNGAFLFPKTPAQLFFLRFAIFLQASNFGCQLLLERFHFFEFSGALRSANLILEKQFFLRDPRFEG